MMRRLLFALLLVLLAARPGQCQSFALLPSGVDAFAYEAVSVTSGAAVGVTAATMFPASQAPARALACTVETQTVRYRMDGTNPTTAEGHLMSATAPNNVFVVLGTNNIRLLRMIATTGTATVRCTGLR